MSKSSDLNALKLNNKTSGGYVPRDMEVGGGDYVDIEWCLDCGQLQGKFPVPLTKLERRADE
jgi:hypothetical protein